MEIPTLAWRQTDFSQQDSLKEVILDIVKLPAAWDVTRTLFPLTFDDIPVAELHRIESLLDEKTLLDIQLAASDSIDFKEIKRIAMVMQHNGFSSG